MKGNYNYYAVTGNPISHSISPYVFNHLFREAGSSAYYSRLLALDSNDALETAKSFGLKGMNITAPFKEELYHTVKNIDDSAKDVGAINVITFMAGMPFGYNTDTRGVLNTLDDIHISLENRDVLILGAGGATRAVVKGFSPKTQNIRILNRTVEKAKIIADQYGLKYDSLDNYKDYIGDVDIIVSTLPDNVNLDLTGVDKYAIFLNANYHKPNNVKHANYVSGEHWLMNQAMLTYDMFTWYMPEKQDFMRAMYQPRKKFSNIILTGFSGSGKSYLGRKLAEAMDMDFLDTDDEIEKYRNMSINDIFSKLSEHEFRNTELEILKRMSVCKNTVIATGGGSVEFESTRQQMLANGFVIYCYAPYETCIKRADNTNRPKLREPEENVRALYQKRKKLYYSTSDMMINSANDADKLIKALKYDFDRTISRK